MLLVISVFPIVDIKLQPNYWAFLTDTQTPSKQVKKHVVFCVE